MKLALNSWLGILAGIVEPSACSGPGRTQRCPPGQAQAGFWGRDAPGGIGSSSPFTALRTEPATLPLFAALGAWLLEAIAALLPAAILQHSWKQQR